MTPPHHQNQILVVACRKYILCMANLASQVPNISILFGRFDISGALIALFVSEMSPPGFFVTEHEEELRILVVRFCVK